MLRYMVAFKKGSLFKFDQVTVQLLNTALRLINTRSSLVYWSEAPIVMRFLTYFRFWKDRERLSVRDNYKPDLDLSGH